MTDLIKRADAARSFPANTCAASRHAQQIAEALIRGEPYPMLTEEPEHCGESILATVAALWEARTTIDRLVVAPSTDTMANPRGGYSTERPGL